MPAVVLLHSLGTDHRLWDAQIDGLRDSAVVIAPDARGHGASEWRDGIDRARWAADLLAVLDDAGVAHALVCGLSMGGLEALAFVAAHPERVTGLMLAATFAYTGTPEAISAKLDLTAGAAQRAGMERFADEYLDGTLTPMARAGNMRAVLLDAIASMEPAAYAAAAEACFTSDVRDGYIAAAGVPTAIVVGSEDRKVAPELTQSLVEGISSATYEVIHGAAHLANVDAPAAFTGLVRAMLDRIRQPY
jgi:3-oxoadipate enol-lactonase